MAIVIISPKFSFVNFTESLTVDSELWPDLYEVLPVVEDSDVWFQFILQTDTKAEADTLCADMGSIVKLGIANSCAENNILNFTDLPERYRIDDTHVLYNWVHGLPLFGTVIDDGECFIIKITINDGMDSTHFCSGLFKRYLNSAFTAVLDYTNSDNFADFDYCGGVSIDQQAVDCTPTEISFTNQTVLDIPYTALLQSKYGVVPTVQCWVRDISGNLRNPGLEITLDAFPPTNIHVDLGGMASGILKIQ